MIWRILNYLFGWDYITWQNSAGQGIARVRIDYNGNLYYWRYKNIKVADPIKSAADHLWLTCSPGKYIKEPGL